jgi:ribosomal protein S27AE
MADLKDIPLKDIIREGVCALCGKGVHIDNHEGRVACDGCGMATDNCTCTGEDLHTRHSGSRRSA